MLLLGVAGVATVRAEDYSITFVFGPGFAATARQGAHAAASASRHWFGTTNATVELRRAGSLDGQRIDAKMNSKEMDQAFTDAAMEARTADPAAFLTSLDAAVQAAALRPGTRLLIAVLNSPPLSTDNEATIKHLVGLCQTNAIRVVVLDSVRPGSKVVPSALELLPNNTGGGWVTQADNLESSLLMITQSAKTWAPPPAAAAAAPPGAAAPPATSAAAAPPAMAATVATPENPTATAAQNEIPVHARFIRTSSTSGAITSGIESVVGVSASGAGTGTGIQMNERTSEANDSSGPMRGLILVESPLSALKFQVDDNAGTYLARVRVVAILRNSKCTPVWSGQKELDIHGLLRDLSLRQKGNLEFMRELTVPGHDSFTIDAKVEDLLAGTAGRLQTPLRASQGARGLMASDLLFVRPFKRAADKFEADQVLAYEGEALSPVLEPVYQAGENFQLQLYLILYPDIHGAQPDMSLELSREGHVVFRMPMQFQTKIINQSLEGYGPMIGSQARAFPYLANVNGSKLSAGNYDAIVTIRQGKNVITRNAPFRVLGDRGATEAAAPEKALIKRPDAEDGVVVLPEIEPATIDSSGLGMAQEEQKHLWDEAAASAREYSSHLPNFRCTQETHRFTGPSNKPDDLKEADSFKDELTFEDGHETYHVIEINGTRTEATRQDLNFVNSRGEFGSMLMGLFDPEVGASYKWAGRAMAMGVLCQVFDITVPRAKSNFTLTYNRAGEPAGYTGKVFVDDETGLVRRLTIQGDGLPPTFPLQSPSFSLEYGMVRIGSEDYLLPLRSTMQVRRNKIVERNESVFREYRRFEASSGIKFDNK